MMSSQGYFGNGILLALRYPSSVIERSLAEYGSGFSIINSFAFRVPHQQADAPLTMVTVIRDSGLKPFHSNE